MAGIFNRKNRGARKGETKGAGVQSRRSEPAIPEVQPLDSVNAPKVTSEQVMTAEDRAKQVTPQNYAASKQQPQQNQSPYLKFEQKDFDENASNERLNNSETFKSLLDRAKTENEDARKKAEASSRYAKAAAWGDMFHALGQLAGAGKNTYIAPDQTYLKSALSKADEARKMYDAIQAKNRNAESQYRAAFMDNERKAHMESEKLRKGAIDEYNKLIQKDAKDRNELSLKQAQYQLDAMYKAGVLSNQQYANETARLKAMHDIETEKGKKEAFLKQTVNGFVYSGDKADAGELAEIIRSTGWQNRGKLGGVDAAALNLVLSGQMENVDPVSFNRVVASFLSDEGNVKNPRVQDFLRRMKVAKATDNSSITKPKISIQ